MREVAVMLREHFGQYGYPIPESEAKYCLVKFVSFFRSDAAKLAAYWGRRLQINNQNSREVLGINYRPISPCLKEMVESMIDMGMLEDKRPKN